MPNRPVKIEEKPARIEVRDGSGHLVAAFPVGRMAEARHWLALTGREEIRDEDAGQEVGRDAGKDVGREVGGDGADSDPPDWMDEWVWEPTEPDEEVISNEGDDPWATAGAWVDEMQFTVA